MCSKWDFRDSLFKSIFLLWAFSLYHCFWLYFQSIYISLCFQYFVFLAFVCRRFITLHLINGETRFIGYGIQTYLWSVCHTRWESGAKQKLQKSGVSGVRGRLSWVSKTWLCNIGFIFFSTKLDWNSPVTVTVESDSGEMASNQESILNSFISKH